MKSVILRPNVFENEMFDTLFIRAMGYTPCSAASLGECYYVAREIKKAGESLKSWVTCWKAMAVRTEALARNFEGEENPIAAYNTYLRAWNYYRAAETFVVPQGSEEHASLYRDSIRCFDKALKHAPFIGEKIAIPYEGTTLPGHFFKRRAEAEAARPTIVLNGGGDGAGEELFPLCGVTQALDYGFNVLTFHGPGHRGALNQDPQLIFRYDWEKVIGPVLDYCETRADVKADRVGLYGVSLGGYLAPRAAAFEPRVKAIAVNGILPNYYHFWTDSIMEYVPGIFRKFAAKKLADLTETDFNRLAEPLTKKDFGLEWIASLMNWTNGTKTFGEFLVKTKGLDNLPLAEKISIPFLSLQSEGEGELARRAAQEFFERLPGDKLHITFKGENGADQHCALNNLQFAADVVYPWFQKKLL
ncbi:2,6-dihydropseudooxynicotine hydrolase [Thermoflexales bacterium]|nr:2,6-dihydropseudooxynicotine hydrolase [Thermoflexales bacterium]